MLAASARRSTSYGDSVMTLLRQHSPHALHAYENGLLRFINGTIVVLLIHLVQGWPCPGKCETHGGFHIQSRSLWPRDSFPPATLWSCSGHIRVPARRSLPRTP